MLLERVGDEQHALLEANGAGVGDHLDHIVPGVAE